MEILRKKMVVCTAFGKYVNGDDESEMTPERLAAIARRFKQYPRQVPIYVRGDHEFDPDARLPTGGWVEDAQFTRNHPSGGALIVDVKLHGEGAEVVDGDLIRGASIGTVQGVNPDGSAQGEVLQHLLLSNAGFDKSLNIAAAKLGGETVCSFFTALGEMPMPDEEKKIEEMTEEEKDETIRELRAKLKGFEDAEEEKDPEAVAATEKLLKERTQEVASLKEANQGLRNEVKEYQKNPKYQTAMSELKEQKRINQANKVRRLVARGVSDGKFSVAHVGEPDAGWDNTSDEIVLAWFKSSMFEDSVDRLEFALDSFEPRKFNQHHDSGRPGDPSGDVSFTDEDRESIRKLGLDPDVVLAGMKAGNFEDYKTSMKSVKK